MHFVSEMDKAVCRAALYASGAGHGSHVLIWYRAAAFAWESPPWCRLSRPNGGDSQVYRLQNLIPNPSRNPNLINLTLSLKLSTVVTHASNYGKWHRSSRDQSLAYRAQPCTGCVQGCPARSHFLVKYCSVSVVSSLRTLFPSCLNSICCT